MTLDKAEINTQLLLSDYDELPSCVQNLILLTEMYYQLHKGAVTMAEIEPCMDMLYDRNLFIRISTTRVHDEVKAMLDAGVTLDSKARDAREQELIGIYQERLANVKAKSPKEAPHG